MTHNQGLVWPCAVGAWPCGSAEAVGPALVCEDIIESGYELPLNLAGGNNSDLIFNAIGGDSDHKTPPIA